ncbi:transglutaminaseTgpA domain-containing protein [Halobacterium yunchengense]|uniref:transglutaminase family protein n=1 Tax=Halobacterium yunchengense TaxID=3108497 RepID=UPI00300A76B5
MSVAGVRDAVASRAADWRVSGQEVLAGASVAVAAAAYLAVLYDVVTVVGDGTLFLAAVAAAVGLAGVLRALPWKYAVGLAAAFLAAGLAGYLLAVPPAYFEAMSPTRVARDTVALLTGYSVLRMPAAGTWATAVAPAPTFLAAYFAFRRQYARAAGVAGVALGFFVLTGDAGATTTLVGVLAAAGAVGFGTLAAHDASGRQAQLLAVVLAVMVVGSATVTAVPGGSSPLVPASATTTTGSLVSAEGYVGVGGSLRLDPEVHFVVESNRETYYRAAVYDRFTGDGWVQTGDVGSAETPAPTGDRVTQTVTAERTLDVLPSAAVPQSVRGVDADVSEGGLLQSGPTLYPGDSYEVVGREPVGDPSALSEVTEPAPERVRESYLQVPSSTDERVADLAADLTEGRDSNYERAVAVERWLEANKEYSLDAPNADGNLVNEFVLGETPGYCTYYASAMVTMLRTQDVPARYVTGYTPGQRVGEDEWVVRGLDSHAWVEVYVADHGWVRFDPTPSTERSSVERERVEEARESGVEGVDVAGSENGTWTPTQPQLPANETDREFDDADGVENETGVGGEGSDVRVPANTGPAAPNQPNLTVNENASAPGGGGGGGGPPLPPVSTLAVWSVLAVGALAGARYTGAADRAYRALWLRWLPRGDPRAEVEAAFERVEYVLERRYRERRAGETVRAFVADVRAGERAARAAAIRERARYAGDVSADDAEEAKRLARALAAEYSRLPGPRR